MKRIATFTSLILLTFFAVSCSIIDYYRYDPALYGSGIDGNWVDGRGMISVFRDGIFETRAPDTQETLSEGKYVLSSPQTADVEIRSLVRGTVSHVSCQVSGSLMRLSCDKQEGGSFSLSRVVLD